MSTELQKYKQMIRVLTYDGDMYYSDATLDQIERIISSSKFLRIMDEIIPVGQIKNIRKHTGKGFECLDKPERSKVELMIKKSLEITGEYPHQAKIDVMVARVLRGN
jgi:hypothetical protein